MALEIERKFLVRSHEYRRSTEVEVIKQGYLSKESTRTVRIRVKGDQGFITVKGRSINATRSEFEYIIPVKDAEQMLELCLTPLIVKQRFLVEHKGHTWEVDEFDGENKGLIVAEIELGSEDEAFEIPEWIGEEVTQDPKYFNSQLIHLPYSKWKVKS